MRLVSTLALEPSNADFVLAVMQDLDDSFEYVFEGEELYSDKGGAGGGKGAGGQAKGGESGGVGGGRGGSTQRALHTHLLHALFRVLGRQFGAVDLLELSRGGVDTSCLQVVRSATAIAACAVCSRPMRYSQKKKLQMKNEAPLSQPQPRSASRGDSTIEPSTRASFAQSISHLKCPVSYPLVFIFSAPLETTRLRK